MRRPAAFVPRRCNSAGVAFGGAKSVSHGRNKPAAAGAGNPASEPASGRRRKQNIRQTTARPACPTLPTSRSRYFRGVPATSIITNPVGSSTSAEPRSGSFKIKTNGSIIRPMPCQKISGCLNSSGGRLKKFAPRQNKRQLGKFARLKLEKAQVNPPARAPACIEPMCGIKTATRQRSSPNTPRTTTAPACDNPPAQTAAAAPRPSPYQMTCRNQICAIPGFFRLNRIHHRGAEHKRRADEHQARQRQQLQPVQLGVFLVELVGGHLKYCGAPDIHIQQCIQRIARAGKPLGLMFDVMLNVL